MTRTVSACALALSLAGCHWGFIHRDDAPAPQPDPEPVDTVAPVLEVRPGGGSYAAVQYVTIAADEPASVRYTLDGTDPAGAGSAAAHVAPSPVFWLRIAGGTTVLRAVATDAAGNVSAPVSETYVVTLPPGDPPAPGPRRGAGGRRRVPRRRGLRGRPPRLRDLGPGGGGARRLPARPGPSQVRGARGWRSDA